MAILTFTLQFVVFTTAIVGLNKWYTHKMKYKHSHILTNKPVDKNNSKFTNVHTDHSKTHPDMETPMYICCNKKISTMFKTDIRLPLLTRPVVVRQKVNWKVQLRLVVGSQSLTDCKSFVKYRSQIQESRQITDNCIAIYW